MESEEFSECYAEIEIEVEENGEKDKKKMREAYAWLE